MGTSMSAQQQRFARDGYATYRQVLDAGLVQEARDHVVWLLERNPSVRPEQLHHHLMRNDPFWVRLVSDDRLLDIAEEYVGPNIALFASHYISKPPENGQSVLWHQDGAYWPLEPMEVVTLWLAVDDATPENGCLRVIPGTQEMQLHEMERRVDVPNVLNSQIAPALVEADRAVDVVLSTGDVSVHHPQYHPRIERQHFGHDAHRSDHPLHSHDDAHRQRRAVALGVPAAGQSGGQRQRLLAASPLSSRGAHAVSGLRAVELNRRQ